jgi:hypothetical protein
MKETYFNEKLEKVSFKRRKDSLYFTGTRIYHNFVLVYSV